MVKKFSSEKKENMDLKKNLPLDPKVTIGKLENGITYYIQTNRKPEKRAELRLVVNAGSILENDDQQGLAHLVEHMAFNGTKNFRKQQLVDYLESIGMRFGPDLNAYTSFDETVYILQVPTDSIHIVEKAFQILEDWAHNVSFEDEEIQKERGVVVEEWRLGRGADARMRDKQFPILFKDSQYAKRLPIGQKAVLDTFKIETLRKFYKDWYRAELIAVVAVGDFDKSIVENLIKKYFSNISASKDSKERKIFPIQNHKETLFAIATDKEAGWTSVGIYHKQEVISKKTIVDYRRAIMERLYNEMFNNRLRELTQQHDPPFVSGFSFKGRFVRHKDIYGLSALVKENGIERGLDVLMTEAIRIKKYGFTQTELDRQKKQVLRDIERQYNERDKMESRNFAGRYVSHFLNNDPVPGIEYEYELYKKFLPEIELEEINQLAGEWIREDNRVIMVNAPEKPDLKIPAEQNLLAIFDSVNKKNLSQYEDKVSDEPLVETLPSPARILEEKQIQELGITELKLSNGVKVILKPTDFKNDEIRFNAFSPGGNSLVTENDDYISAVTSSAIIQESGLGKFDKISLQKKLAGKIVNVNPYIGELYEGFSGTASPKDMETMFQLIYLYFTSPRKDSLAFLSYKSKMKGFLQNRSARPETAFEDTIQVTISQYHHRRRPWSEKLIEEINLQDSYNIYKDRFNDASDFTFLFVGNFQVSEFKLLIQKYLGGLPSKNRNENFKDVGVNAPKGVIQKKVNKGVEPKSQVRIIFTGQFEWNEQNRYDMESTASVLRIKLRETLREDMGGTYGVGVFASTSKYARMEYNITITFGCAPDRVEELTNAVFIQIDSLKSFDVKDIYLTKVKESQRRKRETDLKENGFWLSTLQFYYLHNENLLNILNYSKFVEGLSKEAVKKSAQKYFDKNNYIKVVLYPEQTF
jgi:zinc protease